MNLPLVQIGVLASLTVAFSGCGLCANDVIQTIASPSGSLKAVVFHRDCGATTDFSTQVSILDTQDSLPNQGGNTLVIGSKMPLRIQWQSSSTLRISGLGSAKVYYQKAEVTGVAVSYEN